MANCRFSLLPPQRVSICANNQAIALQLEPTPPTAHPRVFSIVGFSPQDMVCIELMVFEN
jgi:hypothetical protein